MPRATPHPAPGPPLRAAVYDRASKDARRNAKSVTDQHFVNEAACAGHGWSLLETYTDNHRSASRFATKVREDWERLLEDLEGGRIDVLVMWESSRGDRELEMWARQTSRLANSGGGRC